MLKYKHNSSSACVLESENYADFDFESASKRTSVGATSPAASAARSNRNEEDDFRKGDLGDTAIVDVDRVIRLPRMKKTSANKPTAASPQPGPSRAPYDAPAVEQYKKENLVQHNYHDHSAETTKNTKLPTIKPIQGGVMENFPIKLHKMLDQVEGEGLASIVSWQPHGRAFIVHKPDEFVNDIMGRFFAQRKKSSFQRQLNLYGFSRITSGRDRGSYYHEYFLRGYLHLLQHVRLVKVKGTKVRKASNPEAEPDFYTLPFINPLASLATVKPRTNTAIISDDQLSSRAGGAITLSIPSNSSLTNFESSPVTTHFPSSQNAMIDDYPIPYRIQNSIRVIGKRTTPQLNHVDRRSDNHKNTCMHRSNHSITLCSDDVTFEMLDTDSGDSLEQCSSGCKCLDDLTEWLGNGHDLVEIFDISQDI